MDYSPPGSSVHGILQARVLEWVAISFSRQVGSLPLVPPILSTLLNPVSSVLTTDDTHSSTGLHSERLLQPSQTVLHPGPVPGNWQCLLKHRKPSCRLLHCVGLLGSSVTSSSCLRLSFLCASNSTRSSLVSSSCYTATGGYTKPQPLVEDAHTWQHTLDTGANLCDWTCECTFTSLQVCNLKDRITVNCDTSKEWNKIQH